MSTFADLVQQDTASPEQFVRAFANEYPGANVTRALALCEQGILGWAEVGALFARSLANALQEVTR